MLVAAPDDEEVAVLDAGDELHAVVAQLLVKVFDQDVGIIGGEMSSVVIFDLAPWAGSRCPIWSSA